MPQKSTSGTETVGLGTETSDKDALQILADPAQSEAGKVIVLFRQLKAKYPRRRRTFNTILFNSNAEVEVDGQRQTQAQFTGTRRWR